MCWFEWCRPWGLMVLEVSTKRTLLKIIPHMHLRTSPSCWRKCRCPFNFRVVQCTSFIARIECLEKILAQGRWTDCYSYQLFVQERAACRPFGQWRRIYFRFTGPLRNPGRYEKYKLLNGKDQPVIDFFQEDNDMEEFLEPVFQLVDRSVEKNISNESSTIFLLVWLYRRTAPFSIFSRKISRTSKKQISGKGCYSSQRTGK